MKTLVARWISQSGKHYVDLFDTGNGFEYVSIGASGWLGTISYAVAIVNLERRINDFQPDTNKTPMKRVF